MASVRYELETFNHRVFRPRTTPETHHAPPCFVQIELTVTVDIVFFRHDCITSFYKYSDIGPIFRRETILFNLDLLKNRNQAYEILVPTLRRVELHNASSYAFNSFVDEIIECGLRIGNETLNMQPQVLPLRSEFSGSILEHVINWEFSIEDLSSRI
ncbi:hypothetical protein DITRI_Ditri02bG0190700 [Diplodiscus trichospermus]